MANKVSQFLSESKGELKKVTWPSRQEVKGSTFVVIVLTALLAGFIFIFDTIFSRLITFLIR
jgi:preprotein translocase subunit SecE